MRYLYLSFDTVDFMAHKFHNMLYVIYHDTHCIDMSENMFDGIFMLKDILYEVSCTISSTLD
jgi:hypothetical protein